MANKTITVRIRLVEAQLFKKFNFPRRLRVAEAIRAIAKATQVNEVDDYGLFLPPKDKDLGKWMHPEHSLDSYDLVDINQPRQHEMLAFTPFMTDGNRDERSQGTYKEYIEFKKKSRALKVSLLDGAFTGIIADDTKTVGELCTSVLARIGPENAVDLEKLKGERGEDNLDVLNPLLSLREQGYTGDCRVGLYKESVEERGGFCRTRYGLYIQLPHFEGYLWRKRGEGGGRSRGLVGGVGGKWNKQWYVLKKNKLHYFNQQGQKREKGNLPMKAVLSVERVTAQTAQRHQIHPDKYQRGALFALYTPDRTFFFLAEDAYAMEKWVARLEEARRMFGQKAIVYLPAIPEEKKTWGQLVETRDRRSSSWIEGRALRFCATEGAPNSSRPPLDIRAGGTNEQQESSEKGGQGHASQVVVEQEEDQEVVVVRGKSSSSSTTLRPSSSSSSSASLSPKTFTAATSSVAASTTKTAQNVWEEEQEESFTSGGGADDDDFTSTDYDVVGMVVSESEGEDDSMSLSLSSSSSATSTTKQHQKQQQTRVLLSPKKLPGEVDEEAITEEGGITFRASDEEEDEDGNREVDEVDFVDYYSNSNEAIAEEEPKSRTGSIPQIIRPFARQEENERTEEGQPSKKKKETTKKKKKKRSKSTTDEEGNTENSKSSKKKNAQKEYREERASQAESASGKTSPSPHDSLVIKQRRKSKTVTVTDTESKTADRFVRGQKIGMRQAEGMLIAKPRARLGSARGQMTSPSASSLASLSTSAPSLPTSLSSPSLTSGSSPSSSPSSPSTTSSSSSRLVEKNEGVALSLTAKKNVTSLKKTGVVGKPIKRRSLATSPRLSPSPSLSSSPPLSSHSSSSSSSSSSSASSSSLAKIDNCEDELDPLLHIQQRGDLDRATNDATLHVTQSGEQSPSMENTDLKEHAKAGQEQHMPKEEEKGHNGPEMASLTEEQTHQTEENAKHNVQMEELQQSEHKAIENAVVLEEEKEEDDTLLLKTFLEGHPCLNVRSRKVSPWKIFEHLMLKVVNPEHFPEVVTLATETTAGQHNSTKLSTMERLSPRDILLQWFQLHMTKLQSTTPNGLEEEITTLNSLKEIRPKHLLALLKALLPRFYFDEEKTAAIRNHEKENDELISARFLLDELKRIFGVTVVSANQLAARSESSIVVLVCVLFTVSTNLCPSLSSSKEDEGKNGEEGQANEPRTITENALQTLLSVETLHAMAASREKEEQRFLLEMSSSATGGKYLTMLMKWSNFLLQRNSNANATHKMEAEEKVKEEGRGRNEIRNLSFDLMDCSCYVRLLHDLYPHRCSEYLLDGTYTPAIRAMKVIQMTQRLGLWDSMFMNGFVTVEKLIRGDIYANTLLLLCLVTSPREHKNKPSLSHISSSSSSSVFSEENKLTPNEEERSDVEVMNNPQQQQSSPEKEDEGSPSVSPPPRWEEVESALFALINEAHPELRYLLFDGEDTKRVPTADLLIAWVNFILRKANHNYQQNNSNLNARGRGESNASGTMTMRKPRNNTLSSLTSLPTMMTERTKEGEEKERSGEAGKTERKEEEQPKWKPITNLDDDLRDGRVYLSLLQQLHSELVDAEDLGLPSKKNKKHEDDKERAKEVLRLADELFQKTSLSSEKKESTVLQNFYRCTFYQQVNDEEHDVSLITDGDWDLNLSFLGCIFEFRYHSSSPPPSSASAATASSSPPTLYDSIYTLVISRRQLMSNYISAIILNAPSSSSTSSASTPLSRIRSRLPTRPETLLRECSDGVLLCYLLNRVFFGRDDPIIDPRVIDYKPRSLAGIRGNLNLCVNAMKTISGHGFSDRPNLVDDLLLQQHHQPHSLLEAWENFLWFVGTTCILSVVSPVKHPGLFVVLREEDSEDFASLLTFLPHELLLRWINYHLEEAEEEQINNLSSDLADCEKYLILMGELDPKLDLMEALEEPDLLKRAEFVVSMAYSRLGSPVLLSPRDILGANPTLNLLFLAGLFTARTGLCDKDEIKEELEEQCGVDSTVLEAMAEEVREERALCIWVNSLLNTGVRNLFRAFRDGKLFLRLLDKVISASSYPSSQQQGEGDGEQKEERTTSLVDAKLLAAQPLTVFQKVEVCNHVVDVATKLGMRVVGFDGKDIVDGKRRFLLALAHQIWRYWVLLRFQQQTDVFLVKQSKKQEEEQASEDKKKNKTAPTTAVEIGEMDIVKWVNAQVQLNNGNAAVTTIRSLEDRKLSKGTFILDLLRALHPKVRVDPALVFPGVSKKERVYNARYAISLAWKAGLSVHVSKDSILKVRPGALLSFLNSLLESGHVTTTSSHL